jgi:hypothetical protein
MFDIDAVARTHFTSKSDGKTSYVTFLRAVGLQGENLPFEYESKSMSSAIPFRFIVESWGGFENASGEWTIFIAWRSAKGNVTQYIHWTWNDKEHKCYARRNYSFVG